MKYTLLQVTQAVLSSMDSDEITSITDTTESAQVVLLIRNVYMDIVNRANLPENFTMFSLEETSASTPTRMTLPTDVTSVDWVKYNVETTTDTNMQYRDIKFLSLNDFLTRMYLLDEDETTVETYTLSIDTSTINVMYLDDKAPQFYTTYDDNSILFDSVDTGVDTFLRNTKTACFGKKVVEFTSSDSFAFPKLDEPQHQLLLNESKALAWAELRQTTHAKAERTANRQWTKLQNSKDAFDTNYYQKLPNYGRR